MKRVYVDTNLILSAFRKQDDNYKLMETIRSLKHLKLISSTLAIIEMYVVLLREQETMLLTFQQLVSKKEFEKYASLPLDLKIMLAIDFLLNYYNIEIVEDSQLDIISLKMEKIKIHPIYKMVLNTIIRTQLRTLDLLHYSYVKYFLYYKEMLIHYLVTSDIVFQKARTDLKNDSSVIIVSPETLIDLER